MSINTNEFYTCCQCGEPLIPSQFFKTFSGLYAGIGHLPICKSCLEQKYEMYKDAYQSGKKAMKRICMAFDVYYSDALYDPLEEDNTIVGKYFRQLNMRQNRNKTFDMTLDKPFDFLENEKKAKPVKNEEEEKTPIDPEDIEKWGYGLEAEDYEILNNHYKLLSSSNPQCDSNAEIFITDLCYTKMQQLKAIRESRVDDYKKLTESYIKTFKQAGLETVKDTSAIEEFTIGVNIETIEKYTPAEYYKNKNLYKDHDNLGDYVERFLLRPLRNLMFGSRDRDDEFYVKEEEETYGYADDE